MSQPCQIPIPASQPSQKCFLPCGPSYQPGYSVYQVNYYVPTCQSQPRCHPGCQTTPPTTSHNSNCPPPPICPIPCQPLQVAPTTCQEPCTPPCPETCSAPQPQLQLPPVYIPLPPQLIHYAPQPTSNDICSGAPPTTPSCLDGACYDYKDNDNIAHLFNNLV